MVWGTRPLRPSGREKGDVRGIGFVQVRASVSLFAALINCAMRKERGSVSGFEMGLCTSSNSGYLSHWGQNTTMPDNTGEARISAAPTSVVRSSMNFL